MSGFTPGPWEIGDRAEIRAFIDPARPLLYLSIATVHADAESRAGVSLKAQQANARLIAAAPQLLEACQLAERTFEWLAKRDRSFKAELDLVSGAVSKALEGKK